ncbi:uncharacterized protein Hap1MRO34_011286 isoform 3-T3 [Clarias gariepinus]
MHFSQKMRSLVVIAFFACVALTLAQNESVCCREVSSKKITLPITGFKVQPGRPPCVKAVIFYTSEGAVCSHWRESWVKEKVTELRKLQVTEKSPKMNTISVATQTASSTYGSDTTFNN